MWVVAPQGGPLDAPADMNGTRSSREASAQPASTSGLQHNASAARAGRRIRIGTLADSSTVVYSKANSDYA